jgi:prepilin-type N-terminal cleavage/methylation domain-containing protein
MTKRGGFTLVELVVVIVTVGILAGLAVIGGARYQSSIRDEQRSVQVGTISKALETYFTENGSYPNCDTIATYNTETMSVRCNQKLAVMGDDFIEYRNDDEVSYTLLYKNELTSSIKQVSSKPINTSSPTEAAPRSTDQEVPSSQQAETSKVPTVSITVNSPAQVTLNWNSSPETGVSYTVVRSTDAQFRNDLFTNRGIIEPSFISKGLTTGKIYYFKVQTVSKQGTSEFSNVVTNIQIPAEPTGVSASAVSPSSISVTWNAVDTARSYVITYGSSPDQLTNRATSQTSNIELRSNLTQGSDWYVAVSAVSNTSEGRSSTPIKVTTPIAPPAPFALATAKSQSSVTANAKSASCAFGTTPYYTWKANDTAWVAGTQYAFVTYPLAPGQSVTLKASVRCQKGAMKSSDAPSSNSVERSREAMKLVYPRGARNV